MTKDLHPSPRRVTSPRPHPLRILAVREDIAYGIVYRVRRVSLRDRCELVIGGGICRVEDRWIIGRWDARAMVSPLVWARWPAADRQTGIRYVGAGETGINFIDTAACTAPASERIVGGAEGGGRRRRSSGSRCTGRRVRAPSSRADRAITFSAPARSPARLQTDFIDLYSCIGRPHLPPDETPGQSTIVRPGRLTSAARRIRPGWSWRPWP
jgi:hypothetical protein